MSSQFTSLSTLYSKGLDMSPLNLLTYSQQTLFRVVVEQIMSFGVHLGNVTSKTSREMLPLIFGNRNGLAILNIGYTLMQLCSALPVIESVIFKGGHILIVATQPESARMVKGMFSGKPISNDDIRHAGLISLVTTRLMAGLLTNFSEFGKLMSITKNKPSRLLSRAIKRRYNLHRRGREPRVQAKCLPSLIIFFNPNDHKVAIKEAVQCGIPTIGIADSDCNVVNLLTYPVPGNTASLRSLFFFMDAFKSVMDKSLGKESSEVPTESKVGEAILSAVGKLVTDKKESKEVTKESEKKKPITSKVPSKDTTKKGDSKPLPKDSSIETVIKKSDTDSKGPQKPQKETKVKTEKPVRPKEPKQLSKEKPKSTGKPKEGKEATEKPMKPEEKKETKLPQIKTTKEDPKKTGKSKESISEVKKVIKEETESPVKTTLPQDEKKGKKGSKTGESK